jgi:DNA-binding LacI/PurR family transcriptional regulator
MTRRSSSVTIRDVARQSGVSVATVSRYLNQNAPVSKDVSVRIKEVMDALSYVPHAPARHLATRKTRTIGLVLLNMHRDFFAPLITGIEAAVAEKGFNLLVSTVRKPFLKDFPSPVSSYNTDGMLVYADTLDDDEICQLYEKKFPVVLIHRTAPQAAPFPSVTVENKAATRKIVEHLIDDHGRRRIVFMRGPDHQEDSYWREVGYRAAFANRNIPVDEALMLKGEFEREVAYESLRRFIQSDHAPFDAVFAGDDDAAIGVLEALRENGRSVPEDVAVVGFDDLRLSAFLNPPLSTVRAPTEMVGRAAAEQLFCLMEDSVVEPTTLLETQIILRRSCGCNYESTL